MDFLIVAIVCFSCGAFAMFVGLDFKRRNIEKLVRDQKALESSNAEQQLNITGLLEKLRHDGADFDAARSRFDSMVVSYKELSNENRVLKIDLQNIGTQARKLQLDRDVQRMSQSTLDNKINVVGRAYLKDNIKWISKTLNSSNFAACKQKLLDVIERTRDAGVPVPSEEEAKYLAELRQEYELAVRAALEREEQARIRAQIREEQQREKEVQREQARIERERILLEDALSKALAAADDKHSAEIEDLKARLAAAEDKQRAISQAQLTKSGFVYVISNIGSFGEGVFKVGMTRRLEPMDRVRELGDASVPFPFDVHMMISSENAPALENALHRELFRSQINKTNPKKEFFRTDIETIANVVRENCGEIKYVADAEALQYRQSLTMSEQDQQYIEHVYEEAEDDGVFATEELSVPVES